MKIDNQFLARCFGAYMGCDYQLEYDSVTTGERVVMYKDFSIFTLYMHNPEYSPNTSKLLLLLTPLSSITDEDAIEVAKIMGEDVPNGFVLEERQLKMLQKNIQQAVFDKEMSIQVGDYLRYKGYDCGYAHISSLIESGIAVNKTTIGK